MPERITKGSIKVTCVYTENGEGIQNLLAESFALFVEKELNKSYRESNEYLPVGGTICTQK